MSDSRPPCGIAGCNAQATRADPSGVGYCDEHARYDDGPEYQFPLVSDDNPAFAGLDYGVYPEGWADVG